MFTFLYILVAIRAQSSYLMTYREYTRLANGATAPMISHLLDTMEGLPSIRNTPGLLNHFKEKMDKCVESLMKIEMMQVYLSGWFEVRLSCYIPLLVELPCYLLLLFTHRNVAMVAIFILKTMEISENLKNMVHIRNQLDSAFVSVERCCWFIDDIEIEKSGKEGVEWEGEDPLVPIEFIQVSASYLSSRKPVLNKLTFRVRKGERIGIVGRTGSGKSSIFKLLWRFLDVDSGIIFINGVDSKKIGTKAMREKFSIVTQDSALFSGTLRENVDMKGEHSDDVLNETLELMNFQNRDYEENGLDMLIGEQGQGLSQGEKQLVSFVRCILELKDNEEGKEKILLLDECTAKIDSKTEEVIQSLIFGVEESIIPENTTVLIIAHRLNTLKNCDKIMVMSKGEIIEFGLTENVMFQSNERITDIEDLTSKFEF